MIRFRKNTIIYSLLLMLMAVSYSCKKQLNQAAQTSLTNGNFWKTIPELIQGTDYLYSFLPGLNQGGNVNDPTTVFNDAQPYQDMFSDIACKQGSLNIISNSTRGIYPNSPDWTGYYQLIRAANNVIEQSAGISDTTKNRYVGEARYFRAFGYFELVKRFGNVPLIVKTLTTLDNGLYTPRTDRTAVMDTVYADLTYAAIHCPQINKLGTTAGNEYGRITRSAALALQSRAALFEGSWEKYVGSAIPTIGKAYNPAKNFQVAFTAAKTVMTEGMHSLYTGQGANSYGQLFQYASYPSTTYVNSGGINYTYSNNKETILPRIYALTGIANSGTTTSPGGQLFPNSLIATNAGNVIPTYAYVSMVLYKDGLPVGKSVYDSTRIEKSVNTDFSNRDPRMAMSMYYSNSTNYNYYNKKYYNALENGATSFINFIVLRYGEVLLNYAEATYELNGTITDADLNLTVNALRNRATNNTPAALALLTNGFVTTNGLNMLNEIRRERTVELAFEGFRYWDLLRWGTAATMLPLVEVQAPYFTGTPAPTVFAGSLTTHDGYNTVITPIAPFKGWALREAASARSGFVSPKNYLWPIPTVEIGLTNGVYTQNPGWPQ